MSLDYSGRSLENVTQPAQEIFRGLLRRAKPKAPTDAVAACAKVHTRWTSLTAARAKIDMNRLSEEFRVSLQKQSQQIASGEIEPEAVGTMTLEKLRSEWELKAGVLDSATHDLCQSAHVHIVTIMKAVISSLKSLELEADKFERKAAADWGLPHEQGLIHRNASHLRKFAEQTLRENERDGFGCRATPMATLSMWIPEYFDFA